MISSRSSVDELSSFLRVYGTYNTSRTSATASLFDTPKELLQRYFKSSEDSDGVVTQNSSESFATPLVSVAGVGLSCRKCGLTFASWEEQKSHFKSDEHLANVKQGNMFRTLNTVTGDPIADTGEVDDDSSDSESDTEPEKLPIQSKDTIISPHGRIRWLYNSRVGTQWTYELARDRALVDNPWAVSLSSVILPKEFPSSSDSFNVLWDSLFNSVNKFRESNIWAVFLFKSGKFAGGIFEGKSCVLHKVFKRYTVRAKAGGSQSAHDSKNGKAKSAGAMMRRQGEQALQDDIQGLLREWSEYLNHCSLILTSIPKTRRGIFYEDDSAVSSKVGGSLLRKDDGRIRSIPFAVDNPTFESVQRVHNVLSSLYFYTPAINESVVTDKKYDEELSSAIDSTVFEPILQAVHKPTESSINVFTAQNEKASFDLFAAIRRNDAEGVQKSLAQSMMSASGDVAGVEYLLTIPEDDVAWLTPLHVASMEGLPSIVMILLRSGADPCKKDIRGRTPHLVAKDKETRDAYRRYRGEAESALEDIADDTNDGRLDSTYKIWDWDAAGIGPAITEDIEKAKRDKEKEKKKRAKQRKKDEKIRDEEAAKAYVEQQRLASIEAEKKAILEKEKLMKSAGSCDVCGASLFAATVYHVYEKRLCSSNCVAAMRRRLAAEAAEKRFSGK